MSKAKTRFFLLKSAEAIFYLTLLYCASKCGLIISLNSVQDMNHVPRLNSVS